MCLINLNEHVGNRNIRSGDWETLLPSHKGNYHTKKTTKGNVIPKGKTDVHGFYSQGTCNSILVYTCCVQVLYTVKSVIIIL